MLACLFADPRRPLWLRQILREVSMGASNVQRELRWLRAVGLVSVERLGGAHLYRVDESHPLCASLKALLDTAELVDAKWIVPADGSDAPNLFR